MTPSERDLLEEQNREHGEVMRRVRKFAFFAYLIFAAYFVVTLDFRRFLGLTCSAAVVIINFLWLEGIVVRVLRPAPQVRAWMLVIRTLGRFALFAAALSVAILVLRFDAISVLLGFSIMVIGLMAEAVYSLVQADKSSTGQN